MNIDQPPHHPHHHFHHVPSSSFSCSCSQSFPPININICHDFYGYHIFLKSFFCIRFIYVFFYVLSWFISLFYSSPPAEDDILDEADTRRGEQAAHVRLGERAAALVGDFLWPGRTVAGQWLDGKPSGNRRKKSNLAEIHLSRIDF